MPKELFNQPQFDTLAESDRLAGGIPGQTGGKNITVLKFLTQAKDWLAIFYSDLITRISSYPDFPTVPEGKVLSDDGTFKEMAVAVGGFASNIYFSQTNSDITGYKSQTYTPDALETILTPTVIVGDGNKLLYSYLYSAAVGVTSIPSGLWSFTFCTFVDSSTGVTQIGFRPFRYTALGVKEYTFNSIVWSDEINNTTRQYLTTTFIQGTIAVEATDRLGCDLYVKTTSTASRTVNIVIGDGQAAFMNVPLAIRHAVLRDKNGEADFQHVTQGNQSFAGEKTFSSAIGLAELADTPSTPSTGNVKIYPKTDGKFYKLNDEGLEEELGAGGGSNEYNGQFSFSGIELFTINYARAITVNSVNKAANITDLRVGKNGATPTTITLPYSIAANDTITFEATYNRESDSYFTLIGVYL